MNSKTKLKFLNGLFVPIDISLLVYFRIIFGAIMLWEVVRYLDSGWIASYWINPTFHFTFYGFDWVRPWRGDLMYFHFFAMGILSIFIIFGYKYRICATLFFLAFTYMFLLEQARYLNHFYLVVLISFVMIWLPANRAFSIDAKRNPKLRTDTIPAWPLWVLRAQIGVVYLLGGIAKLNHDWLIRAEPMRMWLAARTDLPVLGQFFTEEWLVYVFAHSAFFLDLLAVPFLLWRRSRLIAFGLLVSFHLLNWQLFSIGIFPWFMIFATLVFFSPDWPRRLVYFFRRIPQKKKSPIFNFRIGEKEKKIITVLFLVFLTIQVMIPLRHYFIPGEVSWTEEGHNFSWHMKLRDKDNYVLEFYATDPTTGKTWEIDPREELSNRQFRKMGSRPDMIQLYAHHLADVLRDEGYDQIEIRAKVIVSLNGREPQLLIDPDVNLAEQPRTLFPKQWIIPLKD